VPCCACKCWGNSGDRKKLTPALVQGLQLLFAAVDRPGATDLTDGLYVCIEPHLVKGKGSTGDGVLRAPCCGRMELGVAERLMCGKLVTRRIGRGPQARLCNSVVGDLVNRGRGGGTHADVLAGNPGASSVEDLKYPVRFDGTPDSDLVVDMTQEEAERAHDDRLALEAEKAGAARSAKKVEQRRASRGGGQAAAAAGSTRTRRRWCSARSRSRRCLIPIGGRAMV
jgi:hypothetical protein